ncbi:glycosyltransferase [Ktedonospora formicarum]|uniref:Glycosyltransferase n=1 Tax=Ktedonospora formicarum TaxID=2778364 RepID=A0A8J3I947_9CHLR|nr:glycosyltransferase [Ktedonospora formicarum]GHO48048.1 hypothetical protein KSX_62110 [Ktedonospora formicarum]
MSYAGIDEIYHLGTPWYKLPFGGAQQAISTLVEGQVEQSSATVYVAGPRGSELPRGARLIDMGRPLSEWTSWTDLNKAHEKHEEMLGKLEREMARRPNARRIINVHLSYSETELLLRLRELELRVPVVITKHTVYPSLLPGASGWDRSKDAGIINQFPTIAISEHERRTAPSFFKIVGVVHHGLPKTYFDNQWHGEREGGCTLGTWLPRKGFYPAFQAAKEAGEEHFQAAGICNTRDQRAYRALIQRDFIDQGFGEDVGTINDLKKKLRWLDSHRYNLTLLQEPEPFNYTPVEAQGRGNIVIATNEGAMPELIEDGESGFIVPRGDSREVIRKVAERIRDINRMSSRDMDRLAQRISAGAERKFSARAMAAGYGRIYREVIRNFRG